MPLPPKGHSQRPLHLAIRSMWVVGILLTLLAVLIGSFLTLEAAQHSLNITVILITLVSFCLYGLPGIANIVFAIYLKQRKYWALIASIVLASIELLICALGLLGNFITAAGGKPVSIGIIFALILALAFAQLLMQLIAALKALNDVPEDGPRGFAVLGVQPLMQPDARPQPEENL